MCSCKPEKCIVAEEIEIFSWFEDVIQLCSYTIHLLYMQEIKEAAEVLQISIPSSMIIICNLLAIIFAKNMYSIPETLV